MIEIIKFTPVQRDTFQSIVDIKIHKWGNFIIRGVKVFEKNDQRWISFPTREFEKDGEKKHAAICSFEKSSTQDLFHQRFFESYDKYIEELGSGK